MSETKRTGDTQQRLERGRWGEEDLSLTNARAQDENDDCRQEEQSD